MSDEDKKLDKEYLDFKSLQQSHLKVDLDGTLVQIKIPAPKPLSDVFSTSFELKTELMREI